MQHESSSVTLNIVAWIFFGFKLTSSGPCILSYFDALNSATKLSLLKGTLSMFFHALPRCSAFQMGCQPFGHQTRKHLVMISGLGLNFQLLRVYYELTKWPAPSRLDSSVGRTLHQYRRGHGFESCSGLHFFQALISQLLEGAFFSWPSERWLYIIQKMTAVIFGATILHDKCINMVQYFSTDLLYLFSRKLAKTVQDADHFKMVDISAPSITQKLLLKYAKPSSFSKC